MVAVAALVAVFLLAIGFAQAASPKRPLAAAEGTPRIRAAAVLVKDAGNGETLLAKNASAILPIASITKLMTAIVVLDQGLDLGEQIVISEEDADTIKHTRSRLRAATVLSRDELLLLALMASENRAAAALARTAPGGSAAFVAAMNAKAAALGMRDTRFADPTGLSPANVSSARDLAILVEAAHAYARIRDYSTRERAAVRVAGRSLEYRNTNALVRRGDWDIGVSKTGFLAEAGRCLVMHVRMASRELVVVLLDAWGRQARAADAQRIRRWLEAGAPLRLAPSG